jgi:hypothetical protein
MEFPLRVQVLANPCQGLTKKGDVMVASKKPQKKAAAGRNRVVLTDNSLVVTLSAQNKKAMEQCLKKSGKIVFQFRQIEVTKLPGVGHLIVEPVVD